MLVLFLLRVWRVCLCRAIDALSFGAPDASQKSVFALLSSAGEARELQPGPPSLGAFMAFLAI